MSLRHRPGTVFRLRPRLSADWKTEILGGFHDLRDDGVHQSSSNPGDPARNRHAAGRPVHCGKPVSQLPRGSMLMGGLFAKYPIALARAWNGAQCVLHVCGGEGHGACPWQAALGGRFISAHRVPAAHRHRCPPVEFVSAIPIELPTQRVAAGVGLFIALIGPPQLGASSWPVPRHLGPHSAIFTTKSTALAIFGLLLIRDAVGAPGPRGDAHRGS